MKKLFVAAVFVTALLFGCDRIEQPELTGVVMETESESLDDATTRASKVLSVQIKFATRIEREIGYDVHWLPALHDHVNFVTIWSMGAYSYYGQAWASVTSSDGMLPHIDKLTFNLSRSYGGTTTNLFDYPITIEFPGPSGAYSEMIPLVQTNQLAIDVYSIRLYPASLYNSYTVQWHSDNIAIPGGSGNGSGSGGSLCPSCNQMVCICCPTCGRPGGHCHCDSLLLSYHIEPLPGMILEVGAFDPSILL